MKKSTLIKWYRYFGSALVFLLFSTTIITTLYIRGGLLIIKESSITQMIMMVVYITFFFLCIVNFSKVTEKMKLDRFLLIFLLLIGFSTILAENMLSSIKGFIGIVGTSLIGYYWASKYSIKEMIDLLFVFFVIAIVTSFIMVFVTPFGIHSDLADLIGDWKGIFIHKNILAFNMVFSSLICLFYAKSHKGLKRVLSILFMLLSMVLLYKSGSTTGLLICIASFVSFFSLYKTFKFNKYLLFSIFFFIGAFLLITGSLVSQNITSIFAFLGKDPTMTGRTVLWGEAIKSILQKPIFGYGYQGFWHSSYSAHIDRLLNWEAGIPHAHNGFIDIGLQFGLVGGLLFLLMFVNTLILSVKFIRRGKDFYTFLPFIFLFITILYNISETRILTPNWSYWILYVFFSVRLREELLSEKENSSDKLLDREIKAS